MIVVLGVRDDRPTADVLRALGRLGARYVFLDEHERSRFAASISVGERLGGTLVVDGRHLAVEDLRAMYLRPYDVVDDDLEEPHAPSTATTRRDAATPSDAASDAQDSPGLPRPFRLQDACSLLADLGDVLAVNRPSASHSNNSKPYQLGVIAAHGFGVPETLLTSAPERVRAFVEHHGEVIYKSTCGIRSIVSRLSRARLDDLDDVTTCPTQFQAYVPGIDHRVHVVGDRVFACRLSSRGDDYRYSDDTTRTPVVLADAVAERAVELTRALGLVLSGVDLRQTPDGEWVCFEVNPSPAFSYFDPDGSAGIADAIARRLAGG